MAKPPVLSDSLKDLGTAMYEGPLHLLSTYLRGIRKMRTNVDEGLGIGDPKEIAATRQELATDQAAADERFAPYDEALPIAAIIN